MKNLQIINNRIKGYKYISFDIFDTLLYRSVSNPKAIFELVEYNYNIVNEDKIRFFKYKRAMAEKKARDATNKEDITLDDIYFFLDYEENIKDKLKKMECDIEIKSCFVNTYVYEIFEKCKSDNKTVIITSDMYLPPKVIKAMLNKQNIIGYKKLYISSEVGLTKRSGNLYKYILNDLKISEKEIFHIGNDKVTDYESAQKKGIASYIIEEFPLINNYWGSYKKNIALNHMLSCQENIDLANKSVPYLLGNTLVGPFIVQFCIWLHNEDQVNNFKNIVFVAREGYLIYLIYQKLFPEDSFKIKYLKINRNTLRLPILYKNSDLRQFVMLMSDFKEYTIKQICEMLLLDTSSKEVINLLEKYNFGLDKLILVKTMMNDNKFEKFYHDCINLARPELNRQYNLLCKYIKQHNLDGKVALVNNSMHGSAQSYLQILLEDKVFWGIHFVLTKKAKQKLKNHCSIWFESKCSQFNKRIFSRNSLLFEHLLFEDCGTAKYYDEIDDQVIEVCEDLDEESKNFIIMEEIRNGAISFTELYQSLIPILLPAKTCLNAMIRFIKKPRIEDAIEIGKIYDKDFNGVGQLVNNDEFAQKKIYKLIKPDKAVWIQGILTINKKRKFLILYNAYLHLEMIKRIFS